MGVEERSGGGAYVEDGLSLCTRGFCVLFAERDKFLGEALDFFGFGPGGGYGFLVDEGGDEVAEEGLSVGRGPAQMPVLYRGHVEELRGWVEVRRELR